MRRSVAKINTRVNIDILSVTSCCFENQMLKGRINKAKKGATVDRDTYASLVAIREVQHGARVKV